MSVKYGISITALLFLLFSCSQNNQFPIKISEKVAPENVVLNSFLIQGNKIATVDSVQKIDFGKELNELLSFKKYYDEQNEAFDLAKMESLWNNFKGQRNYLSSAGLMNWIEITGFLLEITANAKYAEDMEGIVYQNNSSFSTDDRLVSSPGRAKDAS